MRSLTNTAGVRALMWLGLIGVLGVASGWLAPPADATPRGRHGADALDAAELEALVDDTAYPEPHADEDDEAWLAEDGPEDLGGPGVRRAPPPGPSIGEVLGAAYATAGLDRSPGRGLARRARLAGFVPLLSVRTARTTSWRDSQLDVGHGSTFEVRATWRLDRLVFEGRELQIASLEAARRRERRALASRVVRAYFQWRRAAASRRSSSRALQAEAELDALTDGWFSAELERRRHLRSEHRTPRATP